LLKPEEKGSSTEISILKYFEKMGVDYEEYRNKYEPKIKFPFSSSRKRMSIVVDYQDGMHLFIKGASEIVLASCNQWVNNRTGEIEPITNELN
jgi:P-type Ca2+ transporter type 2B